MRQRRMEGDVRIFADHRDNLTVDVQNVLLQERAAQMRSEDSQQALLWNVFRSLQKIDSRVWLPRLLTGAFGDAPENKRQVEALCNDACLHDVTYDWWQRYDLPPGRQEWLRDAAVNANLHLEHYPARYLAEKKAEIQRRVESDQELEEPAELPLCIETKSWMLAILAVYKGNLRRNTRYDARRDHVLQVLDAGSWVASQKSKRFLTLVVFTDARTYNSETSELVQRYRRHPDQLRARLPHRHDVDTLAQAAHWLGTLRWRDLGGQLLDAKDEERIGLFDLAVVDELVKYLARKDVGFNFFRRLK